MDVVATNLGDLHTESGQTSQCSFSAVSTLPIARRGLRFSSFLDQDSTRFSFLRTFGVEVEKNPENHPVDPNEKSKQQSTSTYKHTSTMKRKETPETQPKSAPTSKIHRDIIICFIDIEEKSQNICNFRCDSC